MSISPPVQAILYRLAACSTSVLCLSAGTALWERGDMGQHPTSIALSFILYAAAFGLLIGCLWQPEKLPYFILPVLCVILITYFHLYQLLMYDAGSSYGSTDVLLFSRYAGELVQRGENPYTHDLIDAYYVYRQPTLFNTPLLDGDFTARLSYPALSFLIFVPFQVLHMPEQWVYLFFLLGTLLLIYFYTPAAYRTLIILPFFAIPEYIHQSLGGVSDIVWAFFLCLMIVLWRYGGWRAFCFGLACAFKQTPFFLVPFLLIRLYREEQRWQALVRFGLISGGVFLAINLPYILWDAGAWWRGIMEPYNANMIFYGQGLSTLTMFGYVFAPKIIYTAFVLFGVLVLAFVYWEQYDWLREGMWLFPGVILWFGQRSLTSYWMYFVVVFIFAVFAFPQADFRRINWRPSAVVLAAWALIVGGLMLRFTLAPPPLEIVLHTPISTRGDAVNRLHVEVFNNSDRVLTPRFSVQDNLLQPFFWNVDLGPVALAPHTSARYVISTDLPYEGFAVQRGAQVIVSDTYSYDLRASVTLAGEPAAHYFDTIPNSEYRYWYEDGSSPTYWQLITEPVQSRPAEPLEAGRLRLTVSDIDAGEQLGVVALDTWIVLPQEPIEIWIKPPAQANQAPDFSHIYGLELISTYNRQRVWVLFGDTAGSGTFAPDIHYWLQPAPREAWSLQKIDIQQIFAALDVPLAEPERTIRYQQDTPVVMISVRLLLAVRGAGQVPFTGEFGSITALPQRADVDRLIDEGLAHPDYGLIWRGEYNLAVRNFDKATAYFTDALRVNPASQRAMFGLAETLLWQNRYAEAIAYYQQNVAAHYRMAEAYKGLGWSYFSLGKLDDSRRAFVAAIIMNPSVPDAYIGLGQAALARQDCPSAVRAFERVLVLDPRSQVAQDGLAACATR